MGSGVAVYVVGRTAIHVLNPTAHLVFEYLAEPASLEELAAALATATGAKPDRVRGDLESALARFVELGGLEAARALWRRRLPPPR